MHGPLVPPVVDVTASLRGLSPSSGFLACRDHPIAPVMLYDANVATKFADEMLKEGIYVIGFSYPVRWRAVLLGDIVRRHGMTNVARSAMVRRLYQRARRASGCSCRLHTRRSTSTAPSTRSSQSASAWGWWTKATQQRDERTAAHGVEV